MWIDIVFLAVFAYGFVLGYTEGIIKTVLSVVSILLGVMAAFKFTPAMTRFWETAFSSQNPLLFALGFVTTFFLSMYLIRLAGATVTQVMEITHINAVNQMLGGVLLSLVFSFFFSVVVWFADVTKMITPQVRQESRTFEYLQPMPGQARSAFIWLQPMFEDFWKESSKMMDRIERQSVQKTESEPTIYSLPEEGKR
jgi:membrane protein required for colicin V production